ncbi:Vacuolar iron transporter 1.2 [Dichanthelium oligosanthes]|uniref:Vacuolar iron transporter n=1 Tax=Dichanthelium oligosanthes TaxID=888268 RepID=A0A1E5V843_9POAL|nr:Vacuolar iron transporter 1.2 [Dichanthelium oligosanthes]
MALTGGGKAFVQDEEKQRLLLEEHTEKHFTASEVVRDIIIGVSDGLTVPFALAAGLSGANASSALVLTAGLAEVAAGAISMGLGGYLAAKSEADHYNRELQREQDEIDTVPDVEAAEIADILSQYGLGPEEYGPVVTSLRNNPKAWLEFMMKFELGLERPEPRRALVSAATIALSYVVGGLVPLLPYVFVLRAERAMAVSVAVTLAALLFFGFVKGRFTGDRPFLSAVQTTVVGALASAAAYGMARAVQTI